MFPEFLRRQPIQPFRLQVKRQVFDAKLQIVWYKRFSNLFYTDVSYSVGMLVTVSKDLLYGFLVIFDFVQVLTISINEFVVFFRGSNWRAIIHNSKGWSNEKCWKNSNVSFWLTRLMSYQRQKTKHQFLSIGRIQIYFRMDFRLKFSAITLKFLDIVVWSGSLCLKFWTFFTMKKEFSVNYEF